MPRTPRFHGAQPAVLILGALSALALFGASLADFGDPRATARARSQQRVRAQLAELRLTWDEAQRGSGLPPGASKSLVIPTGSEPTEAVSIPPTNAPAAEAALTEPGPLTRVYFDLGHAALLRGDAAAALEALNGGLAEASSETQGYREAAFGAARAAGELGDAQRVIELRRTLGSLPDARPEGTSLQLLAALIPPVDPEVAHGVLMTDPRALPPPQDGVIVAASRFQLLHDPWWFALRTRLMESDGAQGPDQAGELDWRAAFRIEQRLEEALRRELTDGNVTFLSRWSVHDLCGSWIAGRETGGGIELAPLDFDGFIAEMLARTPGDPAETSLPIAFSPTKTAGSSATPLEDTPFSVLVTDENPEGAAAADLRRIRILRSAFVGLGALLLLATFFSARAMARARRLNELRSTFVASVSHDLRTPTQAILLLAQTLEQDLVKAPEGRARYHTQIRREAQRLRRLVEDLLDGARIDRGDGARIERRDVESGPFFDELTRGMEERATGAGARLRVEVAELPATLHVDPDGLYRAIWNLFENALRYGHRGDEPADVAVSARAVDSQLEIEVRDRGPGIPARHAESVFRPFQRLSDRDAASQIQSDTGTGLGLAIVSAICRAHGGHVELRPSTDGACFALTLPIHASEGEAA